MFRPSRSRLARNPARNESGAVIILFALSLTVLIGFAGLTIDSGFQSMLRVQLQNVADAAAHAGALSLDLTDDGISNAWDSASALAEANQVGGSSYSLEHSEFEAGIWDSSSRTFTPDTSDPAVVNAVRVTPHYTVNALVGDVIVPDLMLHGKTTAVAARFPVSSACALPIAIPSCYFAGKSPSDICGMDLVFNADGVDSAGWANLGSRQASASTIRSDIATATDGTCSSSDESDIRQDQITLNNGAVANAIKEIDAAVESSTTFWDSSRLGPLPRRDAKSSITASRYGRTLESMLYVYSDPNSCSNTRFNGSVELEGYAQVVIYDVVDSGNISQRKIKAKVSCESRPSNRGNPEAGFFGTLGGVSLVQ